MGNLQLKQSTDEAPKQWILKDKAAIISHIFSYLPLRSLVRASLVCKSLNNCSKSQHLWRPFCIEKWGDLDPAIADCLPNVSYDWRKYFLDHIHVPTHAPDSLFVYLTHDDAPQDLALKKKKWCKFFSEWDKVLKHKSKIRVAIAQGIPLSQRRKFWKMCIKSVKALSQSGGLKKSATMKFEQVNNVVDDKTLDYENTLKSSDGINDKYIYVDTPRLASLCGPEAFAAVAKAFCAYEGEGMEYTPATGCIIANILRYMEAKEAFSVVIHLTQDDKYALQKKGEDDRLFTMRCQVFDELREHLFSHLNASLEQFKTHSIAPMFFTNWINGTFFGFHPKVVDRLYDMILLEGYDIIYFCLLAALKLNLETIEHDPQHNLHKLHEIGFADEATLDEDLEKYVTFAFQLQEITPPSLLLELKHKAGLL